MSPTPVTLDMLRRIFGHKSFRQGQEAVIDRLLQGRSVLAVFPTGAGKSLCYQLPALMLDGLSVVISPLIALMKDQIEVLTARGVAAARFDSSLEREDTVETLRAVRAGRLKILYISPERLGNERFLQALRNVRIDLLAVDEAHCISQWGHNFRPDYLRIAKMAEQLSVGRVLALTATATPDVARDIVSAFHIATEDIVHTGFYRPNLRLHATACEASRRDELLLSILQKRQNEPTIVYVTLQKTAERVAEFLTSHGFDARAYHAGMETEDRNAVQDAFMSSDRMIVVATIAFGMGVDKSNIRAVYHYNLPKGLEHYMQEIGRAGRDGLESRCGLLACFEDVVTLENFIYGDTPDEAAIASVVDLILRQRDLFDVSINELSTDHDIRPLVIRTLLAYLELDGLIEATGQIYTTFKFQPLRPLGEFIARFDEARARFLRQIFSEAREGRTWFTIDTQAVSRKTGEPRERIVAAIDYLERQGDLLVQASGSRLLLRRLTGRPDRNGLVANMTERFMEREKLDVERIHAAWALATGPGCLTQSLLKYFGESMPPCGHCGRCDGRQVMSVPASRRPNLGDAERTVIRSVAAEAHAALRSSRQLTRFLCGLSSPATSRAKLMRHHAFGALEGEPFRDVLALVEATIGTIGLADDHGRDRATRSGNRPSSIAPSPTAGQSQRRGGR